MFMEFTLRILNLQTVTFLSTNQVHYTQRYCIQDKKSPNFQDIRSPTHETPSLLPRHVNKDATSINNSTNKNQANRRQQVLFWFLFHTTILLYLHFCSWEHCHPLLYSLNSYFFNLFLILICALTFFCNELFFSVEADGCYPITGVLG